MSAPKDECKSGPRNPRVAVLQHMRDMKAILTIFVRTWDVGPAEHPESDPGRWDELWRAAINLRDYADRLAAYAREQRAQAEERRASDPRIRD